MAHCADKYYNGYTSKDMEDTIKNGSRGEHTIFF